MSESKSENVGAFDILMVCLLAFAFGSIVMGCVRCSTTSDKTKAFERCVAVHAPEQCAEALKIEK